MHIVRLIGARPSGLAFSLLPLLILSACADNILVPFEDRAVELSAIHGWMAHDLGNRDFRVVGYSRPFVRSKNLTVYIEGDGRAWLSRNVISPDPTPVQPYALRLAVRHPAGNVAYLARPCQYTLGISPACHEQYWSSHRYAPEILQTMDQAVDQLKQVSGAQTLTLVGFSGGGTVAALLSFLREDVSELITVSANLDHQFWTGLDNSSPLYGSSNAADVANEISHIPQRHFVGAVDQIVPPQVVESYLGRMVDRSNTHVIKVEGFDHNCCWEGSWSSIVSR